MNKDGVDYYPGKFPVTMFCEPPTAMAAIWCSDTSGEYRPDPESNDKVIGITLDYGACVSAVVSGPSKSGLFAKSFLELK